MGAISRCVQLLRGSREDAKKNAACRRGQGDEHEHEHAWYSCPFVVQNTPRAKLLQGRPQAGKPELHLFVPIRVHSWFKKRPLAIIRENPCSSVAMASMP